MPAAQLCEQQHRAADHERRGGYRAGEPFEVVADATCQLLFGEAAQRVRDATEPHVKSAFAELSDVFGEAAARMNEPRPAAPKSAPSAAKPKASAAKPKAPSKKK